MTGDMKDSDLAVKDLGVKVVRCRNRYFNVVCNPLLTTEKKKYNNSIIAFSHPLISNFPVEIPCLKRIYKEMNNKTRPLISCDRHFETTQRIIADENINGFYIGK